MAAASHWSAQAGTGLSLVSYDSLPGISCFRRVRQDLNVGFMGVGCLAGGWREGQLGMKLKLGDMQFPPDVFGFKYCLLFDKRETMQLFKHSLI